MRRDTKQTDNSPNANSQTKTIAYLVLLHTQVQEFIEKTEELTANRDSNHNKIVNNFKKAITTLKFLSKNRDTNLANEQELNLFIEGMHSHDDTAHDHNSKKHTVMTKVLKTLEQEIHNLPNCYIENIKIKSQELLISTYKALFEHYIEMEMYEPALAHLENETEYLSQFYNEIESDEYYRDYGSYLGNHHKLNEQLLIKAKKSPENNPDEIKELESKVIECLKKVITVLEKIKEKQDRCFQTLAKYYYELGELYKDNDDLEAAKNNFSSAITAINSCKVRDLDYIHRIFLYNISYDKVMEKIKSEHEIENRILKNVAKKIVASQATMKEQKPLDEIVEFLLTRNTKISDEELSKLKPKKKEKPIKNIINHLNSAFNNPKVDQAILQQVFVALISNGVILNYNEKSFGKLTALIDRCKKEIKDSDFYRSYERQKNSSPIYNESSSQNKQESKEFNHQELILDLLLNTDFKKFIEISSDINTTTNDSNASNDHSISLAYKTISPYATFTVPKILSNAGFEVTEDKQKQTATITFIEEKQRDTSTVDTAVKALQQEMEDSKKREEAASKKEQSDQIITDLNAIFSRDSEKKSASANTDDSISLTLKLNENEELEIDEFKLGDREIKQLLSNIFKSVYRYTFLKTPTPDEMKWEGTSYTSIYHFSADVLYTKRDQSGFEKVVAKLKGVLQKLHTDYQKRKADEEKVVEQKEKEKEKSADGKTNNEVDTTKLENVPTAVYKKPAAEITAPPAPGKAKPKEKNTPDQAVLDNRSANKMDKLIADLLKCNLTENKNPHTQRAMMYALAFKVVTLLENLNQHYKESTRNHFSEALPNKAETENYLQTLRLPFVKYYASADDKCFDILTALQQTKPNSINEFLQILKGALGQTTLTQDKKVKTSDCVEQYEALQQLDLSQQDKYDAKCHLILLSLQNLVEVPDHLSHAICKIFKLEKFALQLLRNELAHGYSSVSESRLDELCAQIKAAADTIDNSHSKKVTPNHGDITFVGEENKSPSPKPKAAGAKPYNPTSVFAPPPHAQSAFKANAAVYSSTPKGGFNAHARSYDPRPKPPGKS